MDTLTPIFMKYICTIEKNCQKEKFNKIMEKNFPLVNNILNSEKQGLKIEMTTY